MNLCADRLLAVIEIDAIKKELELLRDQYFYLPQHTDFNAFFYEYLEEVNRDGLSLEERLKEMKNPDLKLLGIVATMFNCQANEDKEVLDTIQKNNNVLGVIKRTTAVSSSVKKGKPCVIANRKSVASKEYREVARKVIKIVEG